MSIPPATYDADFSDPLQVVRHLIGDTDVDEPLLSDLEIAYELGVAASNTTTAAIAACKRLMARYAGMADTEDGELSVKASQLFDHYRDLAAELGSPFASGGAASVVPFAGHIRTSDAIARQSDRDRVRGRFERDARDDGYRRPGVW